MRTCLFVLVACLAATLDALAQPSADRYSGRPVEDVIVLIESRPTVDAALRTLIEVRQGEPLQMMAVRESIAHLHSLGRFQDVQVDATETAAGGVRVTFDLIPVHAVERIEFAGTLGVSEGLLRRTIVERYGSSPSLARVDDAARVLEQVYADNGYLRATVQVQAATRHDPDGTILRFTVDPGPRARIGTVTIEGQPDAGRDLLARQLDVATGQIYLRPRLQERLDAYLRRLKEQRFYQAIGSLRALESADGGGVDLVFDVRAGLPVTVRFEGDPLTREQQTELVPIEREGSVEEDLLEDAETRIEGFLRNQGYWKSDVTVRQEETAAALVIVFSVTRGAQYRAVDGVAIRGSRAVPVDALVTLVPIKPGDLFIESRLSAGVAAIRQLYRLRGFAAVQVTSAVNEVDARVAGEGAVQPEIVVVENRPTAIGEVEIRGNITIPAEELRPLVRLGGGDPYYEPRVVEAREAIVVEYLNRGFASAVVNIVPRPSEILDRVDVLFDVREGPQTIVDDILVVGNTTTDPNVILRELQFRSGEPLGLEDRFESQRRLGALGLFRRVRITELTHDASNRHDVLVTVEESPATSIGFGGGIEASNRQRGGAGGAVEERFEFAPRGFFDIGRRNLWGKNRSVNLYTRLSLRPEDAPGDPERDGRGIGFSDYRVVGTYREPRAWGANDLTITAALEQGVRSSFNFARRGVNLDVVRRLTPAMRISGRYSFSSTRTFDERLTEEDQATIDRLFPQVRLSGFSGAIARDTRDDLLDPTRGRFLSAEGTVAARSLGGQVGFMKTYLQGFTFHRLPGQRGVVFAARAALGLTDGFEREAPSIDPDGTLGEPVVIDDLPASERFFAGGDTTMRGYALDSVGAPGTISSNGFSTGGNAVVLLNGELRVPVWREFGAVMFADGGNVFRRATEFDLTALRGSVGLGVRYRSPIGPVRVDLGFKLDRRERRGELEPRTVIHFSIGQAF